MSNLYCHPGRAGGLSLTLAPKIDRAMSPDTLVVLLDQLREYLAPMIDRTMSPDTLVVLRDQYALLAIGMLVVFAAGLFLWKKLRKIEVELDNLREEVNHLNLIEKRRFLVGLNSSKAHPAPAHSGSSGATGDAKFERAESSNSSIVPEISQISANPGRLAYQVRWGEGFPG
jgi:hypothetical protein